MTCDEESITWHVGGTYCSYDVLVYMEQAGQEVGHSRKHAEEEVLHIPLQNAGDTDFVFGVGTCVFAINFVNIFQSILYI